MVVLNKIIYDGRKKNAVTGTSKVAIITLQTLLIVRGVAILQLRCLFYRICSALHGRIIEKVKYTTLHDEF